jgi:hypothetical protein
LAASAGIEIKHIRKEEVVARVLKRRGDHPGRVHIISAMEACRSYKPWHNTASHKTFLKPETGKCLHYYFLDPVVGLCYLRIPTWWPFRLQFYCEDHGWLARKPKAKRIEATLADNSFVRIESWRAAQKLADSFKPEQLSCESVLAVKAEQVATFLDKKITSQLAQEVGSRFQTRIQGTCIKHRLEQAQVKMYDKVGLVLRIETTVNNMSFFKHHRTVEHREGRSTRELAPLKKSIYSLIHLREILLGCNRRYLEFLSAIDDPSASVRALDRLTEQRRYSDYPIKGLNFFKRTEHQLVRALQRPEFNIHGVRPAYLIGLLPHLSPALPSAAPPSPPRSPQTPHRHLPLLPHPPRPHRHRSSLLHHGIADRSDSDSLDIAKSQPFRSRVKW